MTEVQPAAGARVPLGTVVAFSLPSVSVAAVALVLGVYLPRFYADLGVSLVAIGVAITVVRLVDISIDPIFAVAMDRTKTPIGRYRPWLLASAPVVMLSLFMLLIPPGAVDAVYLIVWLLIVSAGGSMVNLGATAWSGVLATSYDERSRIWGWTQGLAAIGAMALLMLPLMTGGRVVLGATASMPTVGWILIISAPICIILCNVFTPERNAPVAAGQRFRLSDYWGAIGRPSMRRLMVADLALALGPGTTAPLYIYFFHDAKGFGVAEAGVMLTFYIGAGLFGAPFWGKLAHRLGKHRTLQISCIAYGIAQTALMAMPRVWPGHTWLAAIPTVTLMVAVGFANSAFLLLVRAMVADVVDEVRLETGQDLNSLLFSMVTTTTKIGGAISIAVVFPILALVGYNGKEGAVNTAHAIFGLEMCYLFAPIILVFLGGAMFFGYRLDAARHAQIRTQLEERDARAFAGNLDALAGQSLAAPEPT